MLFVLVAVAIIVEVIFLLSWHCSRTHLPRFPRLALIIIATAVVVVVVVVVRRSLSLLGIVTAVFALSVFPEKPRLVGIIVCVIILR